jgi:hypothetical protein
MSVVFYFLTVDNCKVHTDLDKPHLPQKLVISYSIPHLSKLHHLLWIIVTLTVGYRVLMLIELLAICDDEEFQEML